MSGSGARRGLAGVLLAAACVAAPVGAQAIDPPIATYDGRARGSILIANTTLFPVSFVLETKSFAIACSGDVAFAPLDTARIHVTLSAMSGRIAAKQRVRVFYDASADSLPAWFAIIAGFTGSAPAEGLSMRVELPHIVYLMQRDRAVASDIGVAWATFDSASSMLSVRIENRSDKLTRVLELSATGSTGRTFAVEACPLFPHSARDVQYHWKDPVRPVTIVVKFPGFSITRPVDVAVPPRPVPAR